MSNQPDFPGYSEDPFGPNPYAPTTNVSEVQIATDDVEAYRRAYLNHEASVKSIGLLYMLGAIFMVPVGAFMVFGAVFAGQAQADAAVMAVVGVIYLGLGLLQGYAALGLRRLDPRARVVAIVLSVIGLLGIPIGTLISAYFLYLLLSEKGQIVFSEHYKQVILQTPHIKYKTSIVVWILLIILLVLIAFGLLAALLAGPV
jgi:hypothetical protein